MVNQQDTGVAASSAAALAPQEGLSRCASQAEPPAANAKPCGGRFDAFADVRMGRSLFDMRPADWIDKSGCQYCDGYCHGGCKEGY